MKSASPALVSLLSGNTQIFMADLITITPIQGSVVRVTSADMDLINANSAYAGDDGQTYVSNSIQFTRSKIKTVVGVQVDELDITFFGDSTTLVGGVPFLQAAIGSYFDGAQVKVLRAFMSAFGTVVGSLVQFIGIVAKVDVGRTQAVVTVQSNLQLLNIQMPKNVLQPNCINTLYQAPCSLTRTAVASTANAGSTGLTITCNLAQANGYFDLGYITFTGGANNGVSRTVKQYTVGSFTMMSPFPNAPATSDPFNAFHGCDKTLAACTAYGNQARFRGMPFIPPISVLM